jgi:amino acid adenylation domain-containing protein
MQAKSGREMITSDTGQCVHERFERQVERTPERVAIVDEYEQMSFSVLNRHANRLAHQLRRDGVGPEVTVALFVNRSVELAVGVLGILKSGGAYVPIDSDQPVERLALILEDCRPQVVVTQDKLRSSLPFNDCQVLCIDELIRSPAAEADYENPTIVGSPEYMAYVIYTSGTTGQPKGVVVEHGQLSNYLAAVMDRINPPANASYAMLQSIAFDASVTMLYPPLLSGGSLHILSRECSLDPDKLTQYFDHHSIDCLKITPSHLAALLGASKPQLLIPERCLIFGGEAPTWGLLKRVHELKPGCAIFNHYGPTETTVGVSVWRYANEADSRFSQTPPIGRPLDGTSIYLLDDQLNPVADGVDAELCIGGHQLARGYLNRPDLTSEKFLPDPFSSDRYGRFYRTGDKARRLPNGNLEFIGRLDRQIKIRGIRIEPGEIESALSEHPAISQVAVEPYKDESDRLRIAAYVVPHGREKPVISHLRRHLRQRLPDPMVPSSWVFLDALPLLPQGKVDRRSLPHPGCAHSRMEGMEGPTRLPRTPLQTALLEIWQETFGISPLDVEDDFFDLGGDSLMATALLMRLRSQFQQKLTLQTIFETRTVAALARRLTDNTSGARTQRPLSIRRVARDRVIPLSYSQERIWFILQTNPETIAYNYGAKVHFEGDLNIGALKQSLTEQVRRHEIYRTSFLLNDGKPTQNIHAPWQVELPVRDLRHLRESGRDQATERRVDAVLRRPFDLTRLPLVRWELLRLDREKYLLLHAEHHMVHDGWSTDLFFQELFDLYKAYSRGRPSPLRDPPVQYADFACWQREWRDGPEAARQLEFWKRNLAGCQPSLTLPTDRPRPAIESFCGARLETYLDDTLWQKIGTRSREEKITPFMFMLAVLYCVLYRYTGQTDINVGTGVANRRMPEVEGILGMLINNLILRVELSHEQSFRSLLERVRKVTLNAFENDDFPFHHVVEVVAGRRDLSRNPLYQIMFNFHDTLMPDKAIQNLTVTLETSVDMKTSKFDLNIIVFPAAIDGTAIARPATPGLTRIIWEYNKELFDRETICRFVRHYQNLLEAALADPTTSLSDLDFLDDSERQLILVDWNTRLSTWPREFTIHQLFAKQLAKAPGNAALLWKDQTVTYEELNRRANVLGHRLRDEGIGRGSRVAVCMGRSIDTVVAYLGVLKTGAAYVPLDPEYPQTRADFILQETCAKVLLTTRAFKPKLSQGELRIVYLDDIDWQSHGNQDDFAEPNATPDSTAYIMYTSGSTGKPKGVEVCHRGVVSLVSGTDYASFDADQTFLLLAPLSFDASTFELWGALLNGARCVIFEEEIPSSASLQAVISRYGVTTMWLTSSLFNTVVDESPDALYGLEQLLVGGEALSVSHVRKALKHMRKTRIINGYGPTECTTFACCYAIPFNFDEDLISIPIGRPVANRTAYILDCDRNPVPIGVPGELYIGGAGVARGYLGQPELTRERFVPDKFCIDGAARLFRTGDLARYRSDGTIEFLGRLDRQIKWHGFRIEPEEIEIVLRQHSSVKDCAVIAREVRPGFTQLLACVAVEKSRFVGTETLRDFLSEKLPAYSIPSVFVLMEALPLTPNGKVDHLALLDCKPDSAGTDRNLQAPRNAVEARLADIWIEVLNLDHVGVHDDFFDLGGHSLTATMVKNRIEHHFKVSFSLSEVFQTRTIAGIAEVLAKRNVTVAAPPVE